MESKINQTQVPEPSGGSRSVFQTFFFIKNFKKTLQFFFKKGSRRIFGCPVGILGPPREAKINQKVEKWVPKIDVVFKRLREAILGGFGAKQMRNESKSVQFLVGNSIQQSNVLRCFFKGLFG